MGEIKIESVFRERKKGRDEQTDGWKRVGKRESGRQEDAKLRTRVVSKSGLAFAIAPFFDRASFSRFK